MRPKKTKNRGKSLTAKKINSVKDKKDSFEKHQNKARQKNKKRAKVLVASRVKQLLVKKKKKRPDYKTLLQKRQKLALAILDNLSQKSREEKKKLGVFGSLPALTRRTEKSLTASKPDLEKEETSFVVESVLRPSIKSPADRVIPVKIVEKPVVSPHLLDVRSLVDLKEKLAREAAFKKEKSFVAHLTDKKKFYDTLNEVSIINLAQLIYLAGQKLIKYLFHWLSILYLCLRPSWSLPGWFSKIFQSVSLVKQSVIQKIQINKTAEKKKFKTSVGLFNCRTPVFVLTLPQGWQKSLITFVLVALILTLPIQVFSYYSNLQDKQSEIVGFSAEALVHLKSGVKAAGEYSFETAKEEFGQASKNFRQAYEEFDRINSLTRQILSHLPIVGKKIESGEKFIRLGYNFSLLGQLLSQSAEGLNIGHLADASLTDQLNIIMTNAQKAQGVMAEIEQDFNHLDLIILPKNEAEQMELIRNKLPVIKLALERLDNLTTMFYQIMAPDSVKRYLLIFQNNREMRASGGFMGSYALLDVYKGKIQNFEVPSGGTYDISGQVLEKIVPPEPLLYINRNWQFHDSNWWPDWPTSARKISWFFERGGKTSIDGVLTITPTVIEKLLPIFGPIDLPEKSGVVINEANLVDIIQEDIESQRREDSDQPKQILSDLSRVLLDKLLKADQEQFLAALKVLNQAVVEKQIMFYFPDSDLEILALKNNLAGEIKQTDSDYLNIVNTNIGGGKTDQVIKEKIGQEIEILADGSITDTLTIQRKHEGNIDSFFESHGNINYLRIYVPLGSQLLEAGGFSPLADDKFLTPAPDAVIDRDLKRLEGSFIIEPYTKTKIYEQFGKTVFANWTHTEPGQTTEVKIKYKLPFKVFDTQDKGWADWFKQKIHWPTSLKTYSLMLQKQAGSLAKDYSLQIKYPVNLPIVWQHLLDTCSVGGNLFICNFQLASDQLFALGFKNP